MKIGFYHFGNEAMGKIMIHLLFDGLNQTVDLTYFAKNSDIQIQ